MGNVALIDGDLVAYRAAASCKEEDSLEVACIRAEKTVRQILGAVDAPDYWLFLSGSSNFRYTLYPAYKANRADKPRPKWLQPVREFLLLEWQADVTDGYEADDALGIKHTELKELTGVNPIVCSLDKDLLQIPGEHYNWVKERSLSVGESDAHRAFYTQLLLGDKSDNVPGFDGVARIVPTKALKKRIDHLLTLKTAKEMLEAVELDYRENLEQNANLLYVWRKENDKWTRPN